jgi:glycosyltransferase involved in cell wall biosynthesis
MDRVYLTRVAALVYQSRWIRREALGHAPWLANKPAYRVPNGYDTRRYGPRPDAGVAFRAAHGIAPDTFVVLTLAKLARHKGQEVAMAALDRLRRSGARVLYVVCGDGAREAELRAFAGSLELPTVFTGLLDTEEVIAALAAADLVVHPSLREIFPNAVGEAMACACPIVAVDGGGTAELVGKDGSAGLLVPPGDPDAMALAIGSLIDDPARRAEMGHTARRRIESEFPLDRMVDGYERALGEVVARSGRD